MLGDTVQVHYTGRLWEKNVGMGEVFDSSQGMGGRQMGIPLEFKIGKGEVIKGWDEGILTMKVGGKRNLIVPPSLGYGRKGSGNTIPPNATLHFECQLVAIGASTLNGRRLASIKTFFGM